MPAEPSRSNQELLDEVRRRAGRMRARRNRRAFWVTAASLAAVVAVVIPLSVLPGGGGQKINVGEPTAGTKPATTPPTETAPTSTVAPPPTTTTGGTVGPATVVSSLPIPRPSPAPTTTPGTTAVPRKTAPTTSPRATAPPGPQTVELAVVTCPSTFGITPAPAPVSLPPKVSVDVGSGQASELAVYSDNQGRMMLVAPAGWQCKATYGADGSGGVVVYPSGESVPDNWGAGWPQTANSSTEAVLGLQTSACQGCTNGQACPLFTGAAAAFQSQFGRPCPAAKPAAETVYPISSGLVAFRDPPGTAGDGVPSGGANPANSVMTYYPGAANGSWRDTCTLPASQQALCTTALNDFVARYGTS